MSIATELHMLLANAAPEHQMVYASVPVELQAAAGEGEAKDPTFKLNAYTGGALRANYPYPVVVDLTGLKAEKNVPILRGHNQDRIVGHATEVVIAQRGTARGVHISGVVSADTVDAKEVVASAKKGFPWQVSIGANPDRVEFVEPGKKVFVNEQTFTGPLYVFRAATLRETSFVAIGADPNTSASVAASLTPKGMSMKFSEWLNANGIDEATLTASQIETLKVLHAENASETILKATVAGFAKPEPKQPETPAVDPTAQLRASAAAEAARIAKIDEVCANHPALKAKAIGEGWEPTKAELEVLKASRPTAPAAHIGTSNVTPKILEAAACMSLKVPNAEKSFDEQTLEAAHKRFRSRIGLQELILECAWANGYTGRSFRADHAAALRAAFTTAEITNILAATANKFLVASFNAVEQTWRSIASIRPVSDFKAITGVRLIGDAQFEEVGNDGQIKHGTLSDTTYSNQAKTYGKMYGITRQDQINDDLGALQAMPQRIGRGGALKLNDIFWTAFMDNSSFFASGNANYLSGVTVGTNDSRLNIEGLTRAEQAFLDQTDEEGKPLGVQPAILLTPTALKRAAVSVLNSTEVRDTTASTKIGTINPFSVGNNLTSVTSAYLGNSSYTGYSATAWYLLANPADLATIEVVFLDGVEVPTVQSADADFNTLGIQMRGFFDFGVAKQEYRGGVKAKGAA